MGAIGLRLRRLARLAASLFCLTLATARPAYAGADRDTLLGIHTALGEARQLLPEVVGGSVAAESAAIEGITAALTRARQALVPGLRAEADAYAQVEQNLAELESWVAHLRHSHACNVARQEVLRAHQAEQRAAAPAMAAFAQAVEKLAAGARRDGASDVAFYRGQLEKLRRLDDEMETRSAERARLAAEQARRERLAALVVRADEALAALAGHVAAGEPVTSEAVGALEASTLALAEVDAERAIPYADERVFYAFEQEGAQATPAAENGIAAALGGTVAAKGSARQKKLIAKVKAKPGRCYALVTQLVGEPGVTIAPTVTFAAAPKSATAQEFAVRRAADWKGMALLGFCAPRAATITATVTLAAKPKKSVRYVAVELPEAAFPRALATSLELAPIDACDDKAWSDLWLQPVPGTLAYRGGEAVLVMRAAADEAEIFTTGATRPERAPLDALSSRAPAEISFAAAPAAALCPNDAERGPAKAAISRKIVQCHAGVLRKLAPQQRKLDKLRAAAAKTGEANPAADALAVEIEALRQQDAAKKCAKLEADATRLFETTATTIRNELAKRRAEDPTRRIDVLRAARASASSDASAPQSRLP